jgi:hypothetical protein
MRVIRSRADKTHTEHFMNIWFSSRAKARLCGDPMANHRAMWFGPPCRMIAYGGLWKVCGDW